LSETAGFTVERTEPTYGDYCIRRIDFDYVHGTSISLFIHLLLLSGTFKMTSSAVLVRNVKCLTVCYDISRDGTLIVIMRKRGLSGEDERFCYFFNYTTPMWRRTRKELKLQNIEGGTSWDWFPKLYNDYLYVFPMMACVSVPAKLKAFGKICEINLQTGVNELVPVNNDLQLCWKLDEEVYRDSVSLSIHTESSPFQLFVDNMDYRWVDYNFYILFIVAMGDDRTCTFGNYMATFSLKTLTWRSIQMDGILGCASNNPYRMQITHENALMLLVSNPGHPCTTYGQRNNAAGRKRVVWNGPADEDFLSEEERISRIYKIPMPTRFA
jgi:hypothetical protein